MAHDKTTDSDDIDESDIAQDSPAEAVAEVEDPDGTQELPDSIAAAVLSQTGLGGGGSTLSRQK